MDSTRRIASRFPPEEPMKIRALMAHIGLTAMFAMLSGVAYGQGEACKNRGDLDAQ